LTKRPHRRSTWMVQSYSPGSANVRPPSNTSLLGPSRVHIPNGISSVEPFLQSSYDRDRPKDRETLTGRQIDRPCYAVCNNKPHQRGLRLVNGRWDTHWRHLANTTEQSVCCGDAIFCHVAHLLLFASAAVLSKNNTRFQRYYGRPT